MGGSEPFPPLNVNVTADHLQREHHHNASSNSATTNTTTARPDVRGSVRRRKSSALGGDIRAGDTGAPAMASSRASLNASDPKTKDSNGQVNNYTLILLNSPKDDAVTFPSFPSSLQTINITHHHHHHRTINLQPLPFIFSM